MDLIATIDAGFSTIDADAALKAKARDNLIQWLTHDDFLAYRPQLGQLMALEKWSILLDSFYQVMPFGTGGRRGAVGIGPNRMNLWTLGASVQGHCDYLKARFPDESQLKVVLAFDVRQFEDKRGVYEPSLPNPVIHLTSRDFCQHAAGVYAANGIHSHILPTDSKRYLSTPELSFSIRYLKAQGGLNMTASHNPPDDNGSKFYDERGAQPVPPEDQLMSEFVDRAASIKLMPFAEAVKQGKVHFLEEQSHRAYIELCRKQSLIPSPRANEIRVVFTPLHGVGGMCAGETLEAAGFKYIRVPEQDEPNGQFPNVTKTPNPEVPECLDRAEAVGLANHADIILATDPDADRLGGKVNTKPDGTGTFRYLTGNEICSLLAHFKLSRLAAAGDLPPSPLVITTEVSTGQQTRIARHFGAQIINDLLVGFKYHADVLYHLESSGQFCDVQATTRDFIIATEESHGIITTADLRDKDSAGAVLMLAELALFQKRNGETVVDYLNAINRQFGYFRNEVVNIVMTGLEGKINMTRMLDALRSQPPKSIGGMAVERFEDLRDENGRMGPYKGETDKAARNFLIFRLQTTKGISAKVCLRPSGTEPKAKAYIETSCEPFRVGMTQSEWETICTNVDQTIQKLATEFLSTALATVGMTPAPGADKLSR